MTLVELTPEEVAFVEEMTDARLAIKKHNKRVSNYNDHRITVMGIAGELAVAKLLGCHFDPFPHRGGDGHRRDLWKGSVGISVKTRHKHLPAHFLFPTNQQPDNFPDNFGVVGRWQQDYRLLDVVGYFSRGDFTVSRSLIEVRGTRSGCPEYRVGYHESLLRPIEELEMILEQVPDVEDFLPIQNR